MNASPHPEEDCHGWQNIFRPEPDAERTLGKMAPLLPDSPEQSCRGRPRSDLRRIAGVFYRFRTGCQWKAIPELGSSLFHSAKSG